MRRMTREQAEQERDQSRRLHVLVEATVLQRDCWVDRSQKGFWCMCGRPLGCKSVDENSDERFDCEHVSGLFDAVP